MAASSRSEGSGTGERAASIGGYLGPGVVAPGEGTTQAPVLGFSDPPPQGPGSDTGSDLCFAVPGSAVGPSDPRLDLESSVGGHRPGLPMTDRAAAMAMAMMIGAGTLAGEECRGRGVMMQPDRALRLSDTSQHVGSFAHGARALGHGAPVADGGVSSSTRASAPRQQQLRAGKRPREEGADETAEASVSHRVGTAAAACPVDGGLALADPVSWFTGAMPGDGGLAVAEVGTRHLTARPGDSDPAVARPGAWVLAAAPGGSQHGAAGAYAVVPGATLAARAAAPRTADRVPLPPPGAAAGYVSEDDTEHGDHGDTADDDGEYSADDDEDDRDDDREPAPKRAPKRRPRKPKSPGRPAKQTVFPCGHQGCQRTFKSRSDADSHRRTHTKEKPLKCRFEGCESSFAHASNRRQHERAVHEKIKRYICQFAGCNKVYAHPNSRKDHEDVKHRGLRPYSCDLCGKTFTARANKTRHMKKQCPHRPQLAGAAEDVAV